MQDVADAVGVSRNTVSLAFRNHGRIAQATRQRIRQVADKMGYQYDAKISELTTYLAQRNRKSGIKEEIAYLHTFWSDPNKDQPSHPDFLNPVAEQAERLGYRVVPYDVSAEGHNAVQLERILQQRGVKGLFLAPGIGGPYPLKLHWDRYSVLVYGQDTSDPPFNQLNWDFYQAAMTCLKELHQRGYERIGVMATTSYDVNIAYAMRAAGLVYYSFLPPKRRLPLLETRELGEPERRDEIIDRWMKKHRPDAILGLQERIPQLEAIGYRVPQDVALATTRVTYEFGPNNYSGVLPGVEEMGRISANLMASYLLHHVRGIPPTNTVILVEGKWVEGETAPLVKKRALPVDLA